MYNYGYEVLCTPTCISFPCKPPLKCHISRCNILYFCHHFLLKEMHQILSNCRYHNQYKHIDNFMFQPDSCNCIQTLRVDFYIQPGLFCHNHGGRFYRYQIVFFCNWACKYFMEWESQPQLNLRESCTKSLSTHAWVVPVKLKRLCRCLSCLYSLLQISIARLNQFRIKSYQAYGSFSSGLPQSLNSKEICASLLTIFTTPI